MSAGFDSLKTEGGHRPEQSIGRIVMVTGVHEEAQEKYLPSEYGDMSLHLNLDRRSIGFVKVAEGGREDTNSQEKEDHTLIRSSKSIVSNGIKTEEMMTDANSSQKADSNQQVNVEMMPKIESDDCGAGKQVKLDAKAGHSEAQEVADNHEVPAEGYSYFSNRGKTS